MTKSKKSLWISIVVLVLTIAIAGASTFAWFTINERVTVGDIDVNVTTGSQGLYVASAQDGVYRTHITYAELAELRTNTMDKVVLNNITSADGINMKNYKNEQVGAVSLNFIEFSLFFRATAEAGLTGDAIPKVKLTGHKDFSNVVANVDTKPFELISEFGKVLNPVEYGKVADTPTIAVGSPILARAAHATRVSFAAKDANSTVTKTTVWDPYYADNTTFCGLANPDNNGRFDNKLGNLALDYYNVIKPESERLAFPTAGLATTLNLAEMTDIQPLVEDTTKPGYYHGNVTIRIWLEGFDGDCLNSILKDAIIAKLAFELVGVNNN